LATDLARRVVGLEGDAFILVERIECIRRAQVVEVGV
jgi:hypothetical protein